MFSTRGWLSLNLFSFVASPVHTFLHGENTELRPFVNEEINFQQLFKSFQLRSSSTLKFQHNCLFLYVHAISFDESGKQDDKYKTCGALSKRRVVLPLTKQLARTLQRVGSFHFGSFSLSCSSISDENCVVGFHKSEIRAIARACFVRC